MNNNIPYEFNHAKIALIAFIADLEKKVQFVFPDFPVMMENIDDNYILWKKYSEKELQELYNKLPRMVVSVQDIQAQTENNTTQFLRMNYIFNDNEFNTQFRRISTSLTIELKIITSNFLKSLEYWEFILSLLCIDNVYTYEHLGNTYQASYLMQNTPTTEKGQLNNATSESKNSIVNITIELNTQPAYVNFLTIQASKNSSFLIDTDIIDDDGGDNNTGDNNTGGNYSTGVDGTIFNSKPNTQQNNNDLGLTEAEEKKLLKNRKRIKTGNNIFDIHSKLDDDESLTYKTILKTDIYENPEIDET